MRPGHTARQRHHHEQTSKALKRMTYQCPKCSRGQNRNPVDIGFGEVLLLWSCVYCKHEWTADRRN
jgi:hypothetical protein